MHIFAFLLKTTLTLLGFLNTAQTFTGVFTFATFPFSFKPATGLLSLIRI